MLRFIVDFGKQLTQINENFVADPRRVGGSMFRIYRDTRFSKDKSPFKVSAAALKQIRTYIAETPKAWEKVLQAKIPIEGDTLKRPPIGFDPKHRFVRDIQRKDFYSMVKFTEEQVCSAEFLDAYVKACVQVSPLVDFLTKALQLQW